MALNGVQGLGSDRIRVGLLSPYLRVGDDLWLHTQHNQFL